MENKLLAQDRIVIASLENNEVSIIFIDETHAVSKAKEIHNLTPVATAALGRSMIATTIIGSRLKDDKSTVSVSIDGGGPIGKINCVYKDNGIKAMLTNPNVDVENRQDGKLNVGKAVGKDGYITVVKDINMKTPYVGKTKLVSGEIAEDFTYYFATSEQQPCLVSLGVLVSSGTVLSAGGIMLAPMPGCSEETIDKLEMRAMLMSDISREMCYDSIEDLIDRWFSDMNPQIISSSPVDYKCDCSRYKMESALLSLGEKELRNILEDDKEGAELVCHFCLKKHYFTDDDIRQLLEKAKG